jgi:hypothetical protein
MWLSPSSESHHIKIHPSFDKFITSLKTAYTEDGMLDKDEDEGGK